MIKRSMIPLWVAGLCFTVLPGCMFFDGPKVDELLSGHLVFPLPKQVVLMEYPGGKVTAGDVEEKVGPSLQSLNHQALEIYRAEARKMIARHVLEQEAKDKGFPDVDTFVASESRAMPVSDHQVDEYIKVNHLLAKGSKSDPKTPELRALVRRHLEDSLNKSIREVFLQQLLERKGVKSSIRDSGLSQNGK